MKPVTQVIPMIEYWIRLAILLMGPLLEASLQILHNKNKDATYTGLPEDPSNPNNDLSKHEKKLKSVLKKDQMEIILPTNGDKKTYSNQFDVTVIVILIINYTNLPTPIGGWKQKDSQTADKGIIATSLHGRNWRNF